jgi:hypothetical protein
MADFVFKYEVTGIPELTGKLDMFPKYLVEEAKKGVYYGAFEVANYAKLHHPYNDRTQVNTQSIQPDSVKVNADSVECAAGPHTAYGKYLELGTRNIGSREVSGKFGAGTNGGWRMRPRPYMGPALEASRENIYTILDGVLPRAKARAGL